MTVPSVSPRQQEILRLIDEGCDTQEISEALDISYHKTHSHIQRLRKKFGCRLPDLADCARAAGVEF